jgi:coenzyme F420-reducing hydrogenase alpha subunit
MRGLRLVMVRGANGHLSCRVAQAAFPAVEGMLRGMPVGMVGQAVRRLHGLCRAAQGLAADLAVAAATGRDMAPQDLLAAARQAEMEAACETGLRLCLDWPLLIDEAPRTGEARALVSLTRAGDMAGLARWLTAMEAQGLPARVVEAAPASLAPAFAARLEALRKGAPLPQGRSTAPGLGEASVLCARGRLTHHLLVQRGRVVDYRIDAPSARRFATGGDAAALLAACGDERAVGWTMQAIDPCVGWVLDETVEAA